MKERQINRMMSSRASTLLRKASAGFEPSLADKSKTRAAIARRVAVGVAAGAAVAAGAKSAAAAPSLAPAALAPAVLAPAAASTTAIAPTAATFAGPIAGVGFATKFVAAMAIVGTVSAGAVTVRHVTRPTVQGAPRNSEIAAPQTIAASPIAAPVQAALPAPMAIADLPQNTANHDAMVKSAKSVSPNAPPQIDSTESSKPKAPLLQTGAEVALFQRAQQALQHGDANEALALLNEQAQRFPNGALSEERDAARVLALCSAGRQEEAAKMGAAFLSAHPSSPSASRVRSSCANGDDSVH